MQLVSTKCCALFEIDNLSIHETAEEALTVFCSQAIPEPLKFWDGCQGAQGELASFYVFTGATTHDGTKAAGQRTHGRARLYAKEFMDLIDRKSVV